MRKATALFLLLGALAACKARSYGDRSGTQSTPPQQAAVPLVTFGETVFVSEGGDAFRRQLKLEKNQAARLLLRRERFEIEGAAIVSSVVLLVDNQLVELPSESGGSIIVWFTNDTEEERSIPVSITSNYSRNDATFTLFSFDPLASEPIGMGALDLRALPRACKENQPCTGVKADRSGRFTGVCGIYPEEIFAMGPKVSSSCKE